MTPTTGRSTITVWHWHPVGVPGPCHSLRLARCSGWAPPLLDWRVPPVPHVKPSPSLRIPVVAGYLGVESELCWGCSLASRQPQVSHHFALLHDATEAAKKRVGEQSVQSRRSPPSVAHLSIAVDMPLGPPPPLVGIVVSGVICPPFVQAKQRTHICVKGPVYVDTTAIVLALMVVQ
jgi:hypothetical protein